jgi:hypothetical protein
MTFKIQNSERLSFRLLNKDDSDLLFELDQDEQLMFFLNGGRKTTHEEIQDIFMSRMLSFRNPEKGCGL